MGGITERLTTEHRRLRRLLAVFARQLNAVADGRAPDYLLMRDLVEYLEDYADPRHHGVEDRLIAVLEGLDPQAALSCRALVRDHRALTELGEGVLAVLDNLTADAVSTRSSLLEPGCKYYRLYHAHLDREQTLLLAQLPALEQRYGERLDSELDEAESETGTAARFEELEGLIERLVTDTSLDERGAVRCRACDVEL